MPSPSNTLVEPPIDLKDTPQDTLKDVVPKLETKEDIYKRFSRASLAGSFELHVFIPFLRLQRERKEGSLLSYRLRPFYPVSPYY